MKAQHHHPAAPAQEAKQSHDPGHQDHHAMMIDDFRRRFLWVLIVTIPVMMLSPMIQLWFRFNISFQGSQYLLMAMSSFVFFYGGMPFLKGMKQELKRRKPGM